MPDLDIGGVADCELWLTYNANNLRVTAVKVVNPSTTCRVHVVSPTGQVFDQVVPIAPTPVSFNVPNNYLTLMRDPVDNTVVMPDGWSISFLT